MRSKCLSLAVLITLVALCTSAQQKKQLPAAELDEIREAVFRYQFGHNASSLQQLAAAFFISIEDDKDPDDKFMERFKGHWMPVKKASEAEALVIDKETRRNGLLFRIDAIKQISRDKVEVAGGYYEGGLSSSGNTYTVKRIKKTWMVTDNKMHWIS